MGKIITVKSEEGQVLLADVLAGKGLYQPIVAKIFCKQIANNTCGLQSCALVLAANSIGNNIPNVKPGDEIHKKHLDIQYSELSMLEMPETMQVVTRDKINQKDGMTLSEVYELLKAHCKNEVTMHHAQDVTEEEFRENAKAALKNSNSSAGVIVNYHMNKLGQGISLGGHHSPLGAYHNDSDRFLIMDVWYTTEECWATTSDLFQAMNTVDDSTSKTRGYCIVKF